MDEQQAETKKGTSKIWWLLVALAIVLVWWFFRPQPDKGAGVAQENADKASADYDHDDILVDLKDNASPAQIAAIENDLNIKLVLVDDTAAATKLYRVHVADPAMEDSVIDALSKGPEVEIAEP